MSDVKYRHSDICENLLTASPIMMCTISADKFLKPVMVNLPVPPNPSKPRRPVTAVDRGDKGRPGQGKARPSSAMPSAYQKEGETHSMSCSIYHLLPGLFEVYYIKGLVA